MMIERLKNMFRKEPKEVGTPRYCAMNRCPNIGTLRQWSPHTYVFLCDDHARLFAESEHYPRW